MYVTHNSVSKPTPWAVAGPLGQLASIIIIDRKALPEKSDFTHVPYPQILAYRHYGLCFGYSVSGRLPLHSHNSPGAGEDLVAKKGPQGF